jgi:hypothetical protein
MEAAVGAPSRPGLGSMAAVTGWLEISHMIGKVVRGSDAGGLLRYLYGPGRANAHIDPHLIAGFGDPAELEPDRRLDGARICGAWPGCRRSH